MRRDIAPKKERTQQEKEKVKVSKPKMVMVNTDTINGVTIRMLGFVQGIALQQGGSGGGATGTYGVSSLKAMAGTGGDLVTKMLDSSREEAIEKMMDQARALGADAIVNVRYSSSELMGGTVEISYTGTAVKCITG